jgi:hypothetical protein
MSTVTGARSSHYCVAGADHEASDGGFFGVINPARGEVTARLGLPQNV